MTKYWLAFAVCAIAATLPLLLTPVLPMADLPQHMAQVAIWKHFDDPCHRYSDLFELRLGRPYLLGYGLARLLAIPFSVSSAFKITVWLSIVLMPLSLRALFVRGGADPWLSLLGFPLAYGYAFYWGFLNFALAIPLAIFYFALLYDQRRRDLAAMFLSALVFVAHALMFIYCAIVTLAVAIARRDARPLIALVPGTLLLILFSTRLQQAEQATRRALVLVFEPERLAHISSLLFANAWDPAGLPLLAAMGLAIALGRPRLTRDRLRWAFFAIAVIVYVVAPFGAFGSAFLYPRFAVMVGAGALFLFDASGRAGTAARVVVVALVCTWMLVLSTRFFRFGAEVHEFEQLAQYIPADRRVAQFNVESFSEHVPGPVFWHFGALYQVRRGGLSAWSFANYYPQIVRYKPGAEPAVKSRTTPVHGIDWPGVLQYDYLLLRGTSDPRRRMFRDAPAPLILRARSGSWWLFETPRARMPQRNCPPLNE